jgi:site-specific recombinase XerD
LSLDVAADLWLWKEKTNSATPDDWVFASPHFKGKSSRRQDVVLTKVIQAGALRAGIKKRIGWHTFRHSTTLIANGENVKLVQELMRYANSRCTLDVHSQARVRAKREAQQRIVEMVLPEDGLTSEIKLQPRGPDERLAGRE